MKDIENMSIEELKRELKEAIMQLTDEQVASILEQLKELQQ